MALDGFLGDEGRSWWSARVRGLVHMRLTCEWDQPRLLTLGSVHEIIGMDFE